MITGDVKETAKSIAGDVGIIREVDYITEKSIHILEN